MKKTLPIIFILCLLPLCSSAQWYLFPGKKKNAKTEAKAKDSLKVQTKEASADVFEIKEEAPVDSLVQDDDIYLFEDVDQIRITLALPLAAGSEKPSDNFIEMYCGALLAARDLGEQGVRTSIRLIDTAEEEIRREDIEEADVFVGPVSLNDVRKALEICPRGKTIISPLDQKCAPLADSYALVQCPSDWEAQIDELIRWVEDDLGMLDEVILLRDSTIAGNGEQTNYLIDRLNASHLRYSTTSSLSKVQFNKLLKYRVIVASDKDPFIASSVKEAAIANKAGIAEITLYSTSRAKTSMGPNIIDIHNANARLASSYYIDYDSQDVRTFVRRYRALFDAEPGSFAFQGYDIVRHFALQCDKWGKRWPKKLSEQSGKGLQSDFDFRRKEGKGSKNTAVRRVCYNRDMSTTLK